MIESKLKLILIILIPLNLLSAEIDQYPFMFENQRDASKAINYKFNSMFKKYVESINKKLIKRRRCSQVVLEAAAKLQKGVESKIGRWIRVTNKVDQRPRAINGKGENYYKESIYYDPKVPDIWPWTILKQLTPIVNFNGIYIGGDKIGHMTDQGLAMYRRFIDAKNVGRSDTTAENKAFHLGVFSELTVLGGHGSQVTSFGDLEANYQGYRLYRNMCEGKNPIIKKNKKGKWTVTRKIDLRNYVTPYMNEVFYANVYSKSKKKLVYKHIKKKYCNVNYFKNSHLMERQSYYLSIAKPSPMHKYLRRRIKKGEIKDNTKNHIYHICKDLIKIKDLKK